MVILGLTLVLEFYLFTFTLVPTFTINIIQFLWKSQWNLEGFLLLIFHRTSPIKERRGNVNTPQVPPVSWKPFFFWYRKIVAKYKILYILIVKTTSRFFNVMNRAHSISEKSREDWSTGRCLTYSFSMFSFIQIPPTDNNKRSRQMNPTHFQPVKTQDPPFLTNSPSTTMSSS